MSAHPEDLLSLYPDLLDDEQRSAVEQHLDDCEACREQVERLALVAAAGEELGTDDRRIEPSADLDARALARIRAEASRHERPVRWWLPVVALPVAVAAAVALVLVLSPPQPRVDDALQHWTVKGQGDPDAGGPLALQLARVDGRDALPLAQGDAVPPGATLLLGGTVPEGVGAMVFLVTGDQRGLLWRGVGDTATAEGGVLLDGERPVVAIAPGSGVFELEIWTGSSPDDPDRVLAGRFRLVVEGR